MKNILQLALASLFVSFMASCEDEPNCGTRTLMKEETAQYLFNDSSYWVYSNITSLELDSETVFYSRRFKRPTGKPTNGCSYPYEYEWCHFIERNISGVTDSFAFVCYEPIRFYYFNKPFNLPMGKLYTTQIGDLDMTVGQNNGKVTLLQKHSTLTIQDSVYNNVSAFHVPAADTLPVPAFPYEMDLYFAPNVGVIRRVEYNTPTGTQTWDLLRYKTVPIPDNKHQ